MRNVSGSYRAGAENKIRDVGVKILTNDDTKTIPSDRILSISIQRSVSGGSFSIGNAPSDRLNAVIVGTEKLPKKTRITVYVSFDGSDWERLGRFYVDSCTRNGQRITVTAYDALSLTEKPVKFGGNSDKGLAKLEFPCLMQEMLDYIVALRGMTCEFKCQPFTVQEKPMKSETEYYTARELFGLIAACHGCNAKMDSEGKLIFREFGEVSAALTAGNVLDQTIDDGEPFTVRGVLFQKDENTSFYIDDVPGSEYDEETDGVVICKNPLATVEIAEYVWHKIGKLSYYGGSVKIRGAGILECGDVVEVGNLKCPTDPADYPFCITDISYSISREDGFIETLSSEVTRRSSTSGSDFSSSSSSLTAGIGVEIKSNVIDLKPAKEGYYFDSNWKNLLGGVYIDKGTTGSGNTLEVYNGALRLLPAKSGRIGGVSPGKGLTMVDEKTIDEPKGKISLNLGKGMEFVAPESGSSQLDTYWKLSPKLGDNLFFGQNGEINALSSGGGGGFFAPNYIIVQGIKVYREDFVAAGGNMGSLFSTSQGVTYSSYFNRKFEIYEDVNVELRIYFYRNNIQQRYKTTHLYFTSSGTQLYWKTDYTSLDTEDTFTATSKYVIFNGEYGWVFTARSIGSPGTDPLGIDCPYGYANVLPYYFYAVSGGYRLAAQGGAFIMPFASIDEYAAAGGEVT